MDKRRSERINKRLRVELILDGKIYRGHTVNISEHGIFVETRRCFDIGRIHEIELYLPSGETIKLQGRVVHITKFQLQSLAWRIIYILKEGQFLDVKKNGMGIELIDPPPKYKEFYNELKK